MDDDEDLVISPAAQAALAEFFAEKEAQEAKSRSVSHEEHVSMESFPEIWQLSQFWYDDETSEKLANELLYGADQDTVIAIISAPSVYSKIKNLSPQTDKIFLFEYDSRFERLTRTPDTFINYDYKAPLRYPASLRGTVDRILADPPFLSEECLAKTAVTVRTLAKIENKTMVCTGRKMEQLVPKLFPDVKRVEFEPRHKGGLANAFGCYMNWKGKYV